MNTRKLQLAGALVAASFLTAATLPAATFEAIADTYLNIYEPSTNYGSAETLVIRGSNNGYGRMAYVKFDIGALLSSSGTVVESASLTFTLAGIWSGREASTIDVYAFNSLATPGDHNWGELTLTDSNAPWKVPGNTNSAPPSLVTKVGSFSVAASGDTVQTIGYSYTISGPELQSFLSSLVGTGSSIITIVLNEPQNQTNQLHLASREHATLAAPLLSITTTSAVPEPSAASALMGGAALVGAAVLRRPERGR